MKWFLLFAILTFNTFAFSCPDLNNCLENISKITGKKYILQEKLKGSIETTSNLEVTTENADTFLSQILQLNGYSRVPTESKDTYLIVSSRDIRYYASTSYTADKSTTPAFPKNSDYSQLTYKFKNYHHGQPRETANSLRPFMSRYGRIIELKNAGSITIHELNSHLPLVLEMARLVDRELSKEEVKKFEENEKERKAAMKEERKEERKNKNESETKTEKK